MGKNLFNVFSDEIWTGKLNYSLVCTALSDDNIVPSRPETQTTKVYFCRVGNCQRSTPLSCLCMHKEHQRLVSDSQMDDLNVTLARPQRQSGKETLGIERGGSFLCCHPQLLPFSLSLCLSFYRGFVCLILLSRSLTLFLPLSATVVTHSSFRSLSSSQRETHTESCPSLCLSWSRREAVSDVALNEKWQAVAAAHLIATLTQITKPRGEISPRVTLGCYFWTSQ